MRGKKTGGGVGWLAAPEDILGAFLLSSVPLLMSFALFGTAVFGMHSDTRGSVGLRSASRLSPIPSLCLEVLLCDFCARPFCEANLQLLHLPRKFGLLVPQVDGRQTVGGWIPFRASFLPHRPDPFFSTATCPASWARPPRVPRRHLFNRGPGHGNPVRHAEWRQRHARAAPHPPISGWFSLSNKPFQFAEQIWAKLSCKGVHLANE